MGYKFFLFDFLEKIEVLLGVVRMKLCISCRKPAEVLSWRGFCDNCATSRVIEAWTQLREKKGPVYEKWATKLGIHKTFSRYIQTTLYQSVYRLGNGC